MFLSRIGLVEVGRGTLFTYRSDDTPNYAHSQEVEHKLCARSADLSLRSEFSQPYRRLTSKLLPRSLVETVLCSAKTEKASIALS